MHLCNFLGPFPKGLLQEIKRLRRDLTAAGAQTFMSPWPGCVKVLVFPEQLFNKASPAQHFSLCTTRQGEITHRQDKGRL